MITDTMQCQTCHQYEIPGHTYCTCRKANPGASDEVKEQVFQTRHELWKKKNSRRAHLFFRAGGDPKGRQLVAAKTPNDIAKRGTISRVSRKMSKPGKLDRHLEDERYRDNLQSEGLTKEMQKNGTVLRADQKENTSQLKQNVNIGKARTT